MEDQNQTPPAEVIAPDRIKAKAKASITARCKANGQGWGQEDSVAVIMATADVPHPWSAEEKASFHAFVDYVVNPSACRQRLEDKELLAKEAGKAKGKRKVDPLA